MERQRPLRCFVTARGLFLLLVLLIAETSATASVSSAPSAAAATTTTTNATGLGLACSVSDGDSGCDNGTATTSASVSAASNNHSYELKCWPRARLLVDEAPAEVTRSFRAVLRVLCVLARAAAQDNHPNATSVRDGRNPGFRFGHLVTAETFDAEEYQSRNGKEATKRFDLEYTDGEADSTTNIFATFSYTCQYAAPGHELSLEERAVRPRSVAWVLLARLACREWWEARAPADDANDAAAAAADSEERAVDAFARRLRSTLLQVGEEPGRRGRRVARGLADNRVDELQPFAPPPLPRGVPGSRNHSYDVSCAPQRERLRADGVELQMTRHLQSVVRYVCALLRPHRPISESATTAFYSLGYIVTAESFDPKNYAWESPAGNKLDVEYADGRRRNGRHLFPVLVRCSGRRTPILSIRGHALAPQSLAWGLVARGLRGTSLCGGVAFAPALRAPPAHQDDAEMWRLMQSRAPVVPTTASDPASSPIPASDPDLDPASDPVSASFPASPHSPVQTSPSSQTLQQTPPQIPTGMLTQMWPKTLPQTPTQTSPQIFPQISLRTPPQSPPQIFPQMSLQTPFRTPPEIPPKIFPQMSPQPLLETLHQTEPLMFLPSQIQSKELPQSLSHTLRMTESLPPMPLQKTPQTSPHSQTAHSEPLVDPLPPSLSSDLVFKLMSLPSSSSLSTSDSIPSSFLATSLSGSSNSTSIPSSSSSVRSLSTLPAFLSRIFSSSTSSDHDPKSSLPSNTFPTLVPQSEDQRASAISSLQSEPPGSSTNQRQLPDTSSSAERSPSVSSPARRHGERPATADGTEDGAPLSTGDVDGDGGALEPGDAEALVNYGENLPTPERLDSVIRNNNIISSEEYMGDGEDFHHHSYVLRCGESGALDVDGQDVRLTSHMAAALFFLCALLTSAQGSRAAAYDFGRIRTVEAFRTEDVATGSEGDARLDVLYEGGALPRSHDVNIFWQTCRPDPPGPEFSLDSGPLLPHSIMWSLFSKVRCGPGHEDAFPGAERYFGDDIVSEDRSSEELLPSHSDKHNYVIRCTPGEEAMEIDGLEVRLSAHMESALSLLCFSAGLHGHDNVTRNLGRIRTVEFFNPEDYSVDADGSKRIDVLYKDNISRYEERVSSMMPECQAQPPRFLVNGREVRAGGIMWRLYRSLLCGAVAGGASDENKGDSMDEDEFRSALYVASNVHNYAIRCRRGGERLLVDGVRVRASRHLLAVLRFLCDIVEVSTALPEGGVFSFGDIATREPFATAEFVSDAAASAGRSFDVQYVQPSNRADRHPTSLRSTCEPEAQFILDGHRLAPHTLVWSLFHHLRCGELASSQTPTQA